MIRTIIVGLASAGLTACASPQPRYEFRDVYIPVPVHCVKAEQIPAEPPMIAGQLTGNAAQDIGPVAASAMELRKALRLARALLAGCA